MTGNTLCQKLKALPVPLGIIPLLRQRCPSHFVYVTQKTLLLTVRSGRHHMRGDKRLLGPKPPSGAEGKFTSFFLCNLGIPYLGSPHRHSPFEQTVPRWSPSPFGPSAVSRKCTMFRILLCPCFPFLNLNRNHRFAQFLQVLL